MRCNHRDDHSSRERPVIQAKRTFGVGGGGWREQGGDDVEGIAGTRGACTGR